MPYDAEKSGAKKAAGNTDAQLRAVGRYVKSVNPDEVTYAKEQGFGTNDLALGKYAYSAYGDDEERWEEMLDAANAPGRTKRADVRFTTYDDPSYEVDVAGVELEFTPSMRGGGVRIDMGKHGEGGYVVLDPQQFANLAVELRQALTFVEGQSRTASSRSTARRVASRHAALRGIGVMKVAGGSEFMNFVQGSDAKRCFHEAQENAAAEHRADWESENDDDGDGGREYEASYTGTIAEKHEFVFRSREPMSRADAYKFADKDIDRNDKFGPAFAIPVADPSGKRTIGYLFYGIASS
jgi:hypothetical protein